MDDLSTARLPKCQWWEIVLSGMRDRATSESPASGFRCPIGMRDHATPRAFPTEAGHGPSFRWGTGNRKRVTPEVAPPPCNPRKTLHILLMEMIYICLEGLLRDRRGAWHVTWLLKFKFRATIRPIN